MARRRRTKVQRIVNLIKNLIAFCFSHIGLSAVVIGYALLGAVLFRAIETPHERHIQLKVHKSRLQAIQVAWNTTYHVTVLDQALWRKLVHDDVTRFKQTLMYAIRKGYDGKQYDVNAQWTFSGAFLYSLTVITTIGYGNISCRTYFGKTVTIMYAIIGIPLMLLFLTNVGDILAKTFKFLYSKTLRCKVRLVLWHQKRKNSRARRALSRHASRNSARSYHAHALEAPPPRGSHAHARWKQTHDSSVDSFAVQDFEEQLLAARPDLEQVSLKESVEERLNRVTVPLSLVLFTMFAYLLSGAALFCIWEKWDFLAAFYFCYISLTTIGFGDLFPGASVKADDADAQEKLVICSLYLLFGMALIAMCFNLAQEEVVNKVSSLAARLGMVKAEEDYD